MPCIEKPMYPYHYSDNEYYYSPTPKIYYILRTKFKADSNGQCRKLVKEIDIMPTNVTKVTNNLVLKILSLYNNSNLTKCIDCFNCSNCVNCEQCYGCVDCTACANCYCMENCIMCKLCSDCVECEFCVQGYTLFACTNCTNMFDSVYCTDCSNGEYVTNSTNTKNCYQCCKCNVTHVTVSYPELTYNKTVYNHRRGMYELPIKNSHESQCSDDYAETY